MNVRQICAPAVLCLARGVDAVAAGAAPAVPTQAVQDALGSLFALIQREVRDCMPVSWFANQACLSETHCRMQTCKLYFIAR